MSDEKPAKAQNRASNVSLHPLTPEQAVRGMFAISKADAARIVGSKPGRKKKG
jgi:hypothetical protein